MSFSHVTPIPRNLQLFVQERKKSLAIGFGTLGRDIIQAYLVAACYPSSFGALKRDAPL